MVFSIAMNAGSNSYYMFKCFHVLYVPCICHHSDNLTFSINFCTVLVIILLEIIYHGRSRHCHHSSYTHCLRHRSSTNFWNLKSYYLHMHPFLKPILKMILTFKLIRIQWNLPLNWFLVFCFYLLCSGLHK